MCRCGRCRLCHAQTGDVEDRDGLPFVGAAGRPLDRALAAAVAGVYATDAVKHFKWMQSGKRRLHGKPGARGIEACRPWLEAERQDSAPASPLINI